MDKSDAALEVFCSEVAPSVGPNYFRTRRLEFELLRMLNPTFFGQHFENALELGCGVGFKCALVHSLAGHVDGIDLAIPYHGFSASRPAIEIGRQALEKAGIGNVHLYGEDDFASFMSRNPNKYDLIYSDYLFEHVPDLTELLGFMHSSLKLGGKMVHVVPNTHDALIQLALANIQPTWKGVVRTIRSFVKQRLLLRQKRSATIRMHGCFVPIPHSEFLTDYADQFNVYRLENYAFPMMEAGFAITAILPCREHGYAIFSKKLR